MRCIVAILLMACSYKSIGQLSRMAGFANTYTLTEADGFPGNNYITHAQFTSKGKIYVKDFFGNLHVTGNNFYKLLPNVKNIANNTQLHLQSDNELWLTADGGNITIIKNDSLYKTVAFATDNTYTINNIDVNKLYLFKPLVNHIEVYHFITDKWVLVNKAPWDSAVKINTVQPYIIINNQIFLHTIAPKHTIGIYLFDTATNQFKYINTVASTGNIGFSQIWYNSHWQMNTAMLQSFNRFYTLRKGNHLDINAFDINKEGFGVMKDNIIAYNYQNGIYEIAHYDSTHILPNSFAFETSNKLTHIQQNPNHPAYLAFTNNKPMRVFPYIKKYPYLYQQKKSTNINAIVEDDAGSIWAGSYENNLSIISPNSHPLEEMVKALPKQPYAFMNAAINYNHKLYFVGETIKGGILQYDLDGKMHQLKPQTPNGFYLYYAPRSKTIWMPSAEGPNYPIYTCKADELKKPTIHWQKLDTAVGIKKFGFATMTEDSLQRIWIGHPKKGFAVYNPATQKAITYDAHKGETPIGFISCVTDSKGTVFMGSDDNGLWYYNDYTKPATPQNIHQISHPLLNHTVRITAMTIYKNWLVMGCYNKICLLNLDSFYAKHKTVVRYLNPQEASLTSYTEQNTMLVSKTDSSLWFGTSDMLYQWDIKTWLHIPPYPVTLAAFIQKDSNRTQLSTQWSIHLKPGENSFDLMFEYLSPDGLPRYTRTVLVKQGDSLVFSEPDLQSTFSFKNLSSNSYTFYVEVFEQDGSSSQYVYHFTINKFIWQHWWFWVLVSLLFVTPVILWLNSLLKEALQKKKIIQLNAVTLSNQFRPHFILNVLNTIGADLKDKPDAESIISRLGESINLIFDYAKQNTIAHAFGNEWILVENIIELHSVMYLSDMQVSFPDKSIINKYASLPVPLGILEIFVENALLHGLRNKKFPPYILNISITDSADYLTAVIHDNGIGIKKAFLLSNFANNGTGARNIFSILDLLNKFNKIKLEINYVNEDVEDAGTTVQIKIPKQYKYEL